MNTEIYDLSTLGQDTGYGTFADGLVTKLPEGYHVCGSNERGERFGTFVESVYISFNEEPELDVEEMMNVTGREFKLNGNELHLRE